MDVSSAVEVVVPNNIKTTGHIYSVLKCHVFFEALLLLIFLGKTTATSQSKKVLIDLYRGIAALLKFDQTQKQNTPLERANQN